MGICQILAFLTIAAHQIWPCHVTEDANFGNLLFCNNSKFNIRKSQKISSRKGLYFRSYQQETSLENTPSAWLNGYTFFFDSFQATSPHQVNLSTIG